jgi:fructose-1,6-bisphosphatase/inositol monophosphatase family enzyme
MTTIDIDALAGILREAARVEVLPRWRRLTPDMIRTKSNPNDLVTEADESAERLIHTRVRALWPAALFIGEELIAADPGRLAALKDAELAVIIDPVDGTGNFAAGLPLFAVMASVVWRGEAVAGLIYDPFADDFVLAEKGGGAFVRRADGTSLPLHVAVPVPLGGLPAAGDPANDPGQSGQAEDGLVLPLRRARIPHVRLGPHAVYDVLQAVAVGPRGRRPDIGGGWGACGALRWHALPPGTRLGWPARGSRSRQLGAAAARGVYRLARQRAGRSRRRSRGIGRVSAVSGP